MSLEGIEDDNRLCYCISVPGTLSKSRRSSDSLLRDCTAAFVSIVSDLASRRPSLLRFVPLAFAWYLSFELAPKSYLSQLSDPLFSQRNYYLASLTPGWRSETTMTLSLVIMTVMTTRSGMEQGP